MDRIKEKRQHRLRRHLRVRRKVHGTAERPRLVVFRSHKHMYCQVIDDDRGITLVAANTAEPEFRAAKPYGGNVKAAVEVGKAIAARAKDKGIAMVSFDRGGYLYHGRIKALADAAREGGLKF